MTEEKLKTLFRKYAKVYIDPEDYDLESTFSDDDPIQVMTEYEFIRAMLSAGIIEIPNEI